MFVFRCVHRTEKTQWLDGHLASCDDLTWCDDLRCSPMPPQATNVPMPTGQSVRFLENEMHRLAGVELSEIAKAATRSKSMSACNILSAHPFPSMGD